MSKTYRAAGLLLCITFVLHAALGEWFYKTSIGGVYMTELILVLIALAIGFAGLSLTEFPWLFGFASLTAGYLVVSLFSGRELYWVIRQGSFALYLVAAAVFYLLVRRRWWTDGQIEIYWRRSFWIGLSLLVLHFAGSSKLTVPGCATYAAFLLLAMGYCFYLERISSSAKKIAFAVPLACITGICTNSFTPAASLLIALVLSLTAFSLRRLVALGSLSLVAFLLVLPRLEGLHDANAIWRYLYWTSVLGDRWHHGFGLLGNGFGIQYLPESSPEFEGIIAQVSDVLDPEALFYQLMTVPPHNAPLEVLIYLGLPGVILCFYPCAKIFVAVYLRRERGYVRTVFLQSTICFIMLNANQGISVPYVAPLFWGLMGTAMAMLARGEEGARAQEPPSVERRATVAS